MTVEELIETLREYDPETEVMLSFQVGGPGISVHLAEDIHSTELGTIAQVGPRWIVGEPDDPDATTREVVLLG